MKQGRHENIIDALKDQLRQAVPLDVPEMQPSVCLPPSFEKVTQARRAVVIDLEGTGYPPVDGRSLVEICAVELVEGVPTGRIYHSLINPNAPINAYATKIHGLTDEDVQDAPTFADIAGDVAAFIGDAIVVSHDVASDLTMLNPELQEAGYGPIDLERTHCTRKLAALLLPREPLKLLPLSTRCGIDVSEEKFHGASTDAQVCAFIHLRLMEAGTAALARRRERKAKEQAAKQERRAARLADPSR